MLIQSFWALAAAASFSTMAAFVKFCNATFGPLELVFTALYLPLSPFMQLSSGTAIHSKLLRLKVILFETLLALLQLPFGSLLLENFLSEPTLR